MSPGSPPFSEELAAVAGLDSGVARAIAANYLPLAHWLLSEYREHGYLTIGINGAQGCGKSTLVQFLALFLEYHTTRPVATLSLDDLYLNRTQRRQRAAEIHPLLTTRGVPGTHHVALGIELLDRLRSLAPGEQRVLPRFDKARDNPHPAAHWPRVDGPPALTLFEGWCVAARPQAAARLDCPANALERDEDPNGRWRHYVNQALATDYQSLFARLDRLIMLRAPDFDCVYHWRARQERHLATQHSEPPGARLMDDSALRRFVQHYQRLTEAMLEEMPSRADVLVELDRNQQVVDIHYRR